MIDNDLVKHIAGLSRIGIGEDEVEKFRASLESVLEYVDKLKEVDVSEIKSEVGIAGASFKNGFRENSSDKESALGAHPDRAILMNMAPKTRNGYIEVDQILNK
ncbi:MAG: hypothetical protein A3B96_03825 [Candidatus Spechtbacteria bacterium RIFCSPHIGHO2_02_FULL_43_15b]|uniref:Aspartyl/glutamyl-tRNA(Asn/Gln) amidotransferase subunit C n=1 Tax=Candidatus Spechtbacteria bacterium RIFCSPHIGHO2_01_FULL_43_30 TaxID=1802158 RepID=A0A1G2H8S3_9BACT|nr:MAG: hypothetical protein A2827_03345 [Candidatus Spechtbacteria bacterium RIFCSPHIGHO2_01_FULL_43_30]OGZ59137.1 MAG: hypothetical protein A3B96_03825 [Candidatus Spechtbacteria bacterium RIFCSPHIGHO2_02_FULL_43_15b]